MTIRIVTDSTADLPSEYIERFHITVVPLTVIFGDDEFLDGVDITSEQFFRRMAREQVMPTTAQPSAGLFRQTYERLVAEGATEILSIHISERISGTLESARQGAAGLSVHVRHVDSQQVSLALGVGVIEAARAVEAGAAVEAVREIAEDTFRRTKFYFTVDSLEHLRRGGRLNRGQEMLGTLLQVKPIITFEAGEPVPVGRIRTKQKALEDIVTRTAAARPLAYTVAAHTTAPDDAQYVSKRLQGIARDATHIVSRLGPVLGVHGGPGVVGCGGVAAPDDRSPASLRR